MQTNYHNMQTHFIQCIYKPFHVTSKYAFGAEIKHLPNPVGCNFDNCFFWVILIFYVSNILSTRTCTTQRNLTIEKIKQCFDVSEPWFYYLLFMDIHINHYTRPHFIQCKTTSLPTLKPYAQMTRHFQDNPRLTIYIGLYLPAHLA